MAVTVGNTSSSGDKGSATIYSWSHTCQAGTNLLVVTTRVRDTSDAEQVVTGITYDGNPFTGKAVSREVAGVYDMGAGVWYLIDPPTGSSLVIEVTHAGKCSDVSGAAIDLKGVDTGDVVDSTADGLVLLQASASLTIDPASSGSMMVYALTDGLADPASFSVDTGTEIDRVDMGSYSALSAYNPESGGTATVAVSWTGDEYAVHVAATFNEAAEMFPPVPGRVHRDRRSPLLRM